MARKSVTQQDLADRSRVSRSTVAAVLRNDTRFRFTEETRRRVLEAARKLNYQPNAGARALRNGQTHAFVLAIPQFEQLSGAIQAQNLRGMGEAAQQLGYSFTICSYGTVKQMKPAFERLMRESRFDGVVMHGDESCEEDPREAIVDAFGLPCVVLERHSHHSAWVDFDHRAGAAMATTYLLERGRRRIALVGAGHAQRQQGYEESLRRAGLAIDDRWIVPRYSGEAYDHLGQRAIQALFADGQVQPDALFCLSDEIAASAIALLTARGVRVPEDVAVIGYDDSTMARYANPPLTSVRQDGVKMGHEAIRLLVQQISDPDTSVEPVVLAPTLTVRRSCGAGL